MINELLDLAKIEAGKAEVRFDGVSVSDLCQTLVALMKPLADKKQQTMNLELPPDIPIVNTDAGKLQQVLYNLLSNAVKFTPAGGAITVSAAREVIQRNGRDIEDVSISVADSGPGIPESEQQRIFEKFYQSDRSLTRESSGTGLGLAIARELTNLLLGRLTLKSEPGHGATFTITLPVNPPVETQTPAKA
jgi:signal transduction histidine kinase